jgi:hypothetical protein
MNAREAVAVQIALNLLNHAIVNQQHAILAQQLQRRRKVW